jgi:glycosyltransferase involved in cell wall biosynthesis
MHFFTRLRKAKVVFVAYDYNPTGGSCVSANHYFNYWRSQGAVVEKLSLNVRYGFFKITAACMFAKNIVFNGLYCFNFLELIFVCLLRKDSIIYLHESEYAFSTFEKQTPFKFALLKRAIKNHKIACISKLQQDYLHAAFGNIKTHLIYNTEPFIKKLERNEDAINILMVGYLMQRKGVDFYSKLADYAKDKNPNWKFYWIGGPGGERKPLYFSENVTWMGAQASPHYYYDKIDLFFLSSIDEPMGLVCAEALMHHKKCIVYKNTGFAEFIGDIEGCSIYEAYTVESAYEVIEKAISTSLDIAKTDKLLNHYFSVEAFSKRLDDFIAT